MNQLNVTVKAASAGATPAAGETLASHAYQRLRQDIISGAHAPGAKLRILELCDRYAIGPSPIREALNRLSRDGLVAQSDHRGFSVTALSRAHLEELTKTRCWLTELGLRESIAHGDSAWEEGIVLAQHRLSRVPRHVSGEDGSTYNTAWEEAHRAFHRSLIAACGSVWLIGFCEQLFDAADCYRHLARATSRKRKAPRDEHPAMVEAILARDAESAVALLRAHYMRTADLVRDQLE